MEEHHRLLNIFDILLLDKNKEAIKIVEENRLTNIYSPEDKIRMDIDKQIEDSAFVGRSGRCGWRS